MSFALRLGSDMVEVEAGSAAPLTVEMTSRSDAQEEYEIEVQGLDPEWIALPVPTVKIDPRDTRSERIFLKPPRSSESLAGNYPFIVKVRNLTTGDSRSEQAALVI